MKVLGIVGYSGSGKTTRIVSLIPRITARGFSVSTIKHAHHGFDIDREGKDSFKHREAGASEVLIASGDRWALMHEVREAKPPSLDQMLAKLEPVDLVLVEGFKYEDYPMLEVWSPKSETQPLFPLRKKIIGLICDDPIEPAEFGRPGLPVFDPNADEALAEFIIEYLNESESRSTS